MISLAPLITFLLILAPHLSRPLLKVAAHILPFISVCVALSLSLFLFHSIVSYVLTTLIVEIIKKSWCAATKKHMEYASRQQRIRDSMWCDFGRYFNGFVLFWIILFKITKKNENENSSWVHRAKSRRRTRLSCIAIIVMCSHYNYSHICSKLFC